MRYDEAVRKCEMFSRGLVPKFCQPGQQTFIGIYAHNRPEWIIAEHACFNYSMVVVPIYNTAGLDSIKKVLPETELPVIVIDTAAKLELLIENRNAFQTLKLIVVVDDVISRIKPTLKTEADKMNLTILTMTDILKMGENNRQPIAFIPPEPSSLAIISYTSGTGGSSRGAMLTHASVVANCTSLTFSYTVKFTTDDVLFSFLPAAHCFERFIEELMIMTGGAIGFSSGNVLLLADDLFHLRPTKMPCVPSLLNRFYNNMMAKINERRIVKFLFLRAHAAKKRLLEKHIVCDDTIWDIILFKKMRNYFGGRLKALFCGSAPCSVEALTFMRVVLGCVIIEGYGCTENAGAASCTLEGDFEPGHVGPPCPCSRIKLCEISETEHMGAEKAGEICISGPTVFQGYFKDPESTANVVDKDGWLHTGDIGVWTERGSLKVIGRKNSLFKLPHGMFIAPEKIENVYIRSQFIFQTFVYGDKDHEYLVAVIVPDFNYLKTTLRPILGAKVDYNALLCSDEAVITVIKHDMNEKATAAGLNPMEQVKKITLIAEPFTVENGLITPTMKMKRVACAKRFAANIVEMYNKP